MARGLKRVGRQHLTLSRVRSGDAFRFEDAAGDVITDDSHRQRILALGIPPAWENVRIAVHPTAHVQAIGVDEAGRTQYIYHADWEARRAEKKRIRLADLTTVLPRIRRRVAKDLSTPSGELSLAVAIAVALIDATGMRLGRERYLKASGTRGAGTLYARDIVVNGDDICVRFKAKGGKAAEYCFVDARLAGAIARIQELPGRRLLVYRAQDGKVRPIQTEAVNSYLKEISGTSISAKDFRTLHASALAGEALSRIEPAKTVTGRKRHMAAVVREVSEFLKNTPAICRKSYIAPCLFELFEKDRLQAAWLAESKGGTGLRQRERRLAQVLAAS